MIGIFCILAMAYLGWRHGADMHALGRRLGNVEGRFEAEAEQLDRVRQNQEAAMRAAKAHRAHLRVVK